jgi:hypothetical protein
MSICSGLGCAPAGSIKGSFNFWTTQGQADSLAKTSLGHKRKSIIGWHNKQVQIRAQYLRHDAAYQFYAVLKCSGQLVITITF